MQDLPVLAGVSLIVVVLIGLMVLIRSSAAGEAPRVTWRRILVIAAAVAGTLLSLTLCRLRFAGEVVDVDTASQKFIVGPLDSPNIVWVAISVLLTLILWGLAISQISSIPPVIDGLVGDNETIGTTDTDNEETT